MWENCPEKPARLKKFSASGERAICINMYETFFIDSATGFFLFRKSAGFDKFTETEKLKERTTDFKRIRCPECRWQPTASSRWYCTYAPEYPHFFFNGCGTSWNTFETRGCCPGCAHQWTWTDCLRCWCSSPHEAWYADEID